MTTKLAPLVNPAESDPYGRTAIIQILRIHWYERWSPVERERFLSIIESEFSAVTTDVIDHLQWAAQDRRRIV